MDKKLAEHKGESLEEVDAFLRDRFKVHPLRSFAKCHRAPMGEGGLEGYESDKSYQYIIKKDNRGLYVRIWPDKHDDKYYETCGLGTFEKFFTDK